MSRYIDADKMIADLLTVDPQYETMIRWCCDVTNAQPTADVVEVVRCKDCKYWLPHTQCGFDEDNDEYHNYCNYHMPDDKWYAEYWEADDYCNYGKRKDNE